MDSLTRERRRKSARGSTFDDGIWGWGDWEDLAVGVLLKIEKRFSPLPSLH